MKIGAAAQATIETQPIAAARDLMRRLYQPRNACSSTGSNRPSGPWRVGEPASSMNQR